MKRPNFNVGSKVKAIVHTNYEEMCGTDIYGWRGTVTSIVGFNDNWEKVSEPYTPENYPTRWSVAVDFVSPEDDCRIEKVITTDYKNEIELVQKKFIDIDYLREDDLEIGEKPDGSKIIRPANSKAFEVGDHIQITTKIDGANAAIAWDETTNKLEIFSRTNLLSPMNDLRGFYNYVKTVVEPKADWSKYDSYVFFGEWCVGHTIKDYNKEWFNKWRVYDIWDKSANSYLPQTTVKNICTQLGIEYIEELYYGPFISWEHCKSFLNKSAVYGPTQEGIVIKNQTKLGINNKYPCYLKIVNTAFAEYQHSKKEKKPIDPLEDLEKQNAANLASTIITEARIRKLILKLIDEAKLPSELKPTDMSAIMKLLPKCVFDDVIKEEKEVVVQLGKFAGKAISQQTAKLARKIVIGSI